MSEHFYLYCESCKEHVPNREQGERNSHEATDLVIKYRAELLLLLDAGFEIRHWGIGHVPGAFLEAHQGHKLRHISEYDR